MSIQNINIITTGGTIEKSYDELDGSLDNRTSILKSHVISKLRLPYQKLNFFPLFAKDSLDMNEEDRIWINAKTVELMTEKDPILIMHGTDTMADSASFMHSKVKDITVPVIFTGAMRPIGFSDSDALQNFTEALMASEIASPGIYIAFHGKLFSAPHIRKNKARGTFEYIDD